MKISNLIMSILIATTMVYGCSTEASVKVSSQLTAPYITDSDHQREDDTALEDKINQLFNKNNIAGKIKPVVLDYNVLLVGQFANEAEESKAISLIKTLPSPKKIFNYSSISPKPKLDLNSSITDEAVNRLETQNNILGKSMKVVTVDETVFLMGTNIGDLSALNDAIDGIYSIPGVKKVINLVQPGIHDYYSAPPPVPRG